MAFIDIDLRFVDNDLELDRLADFLGILEKQLASAIKKEKKKTERLLKRQKKNIDEQELSFIEQRLDDLVEDTLPRFFRGPFICAMWAVIESTINDVASYIQKEQKQVIRMKDIRSDNMLDMANKYFNHILKFKLFDDINVMNRLDMIRVLRSNQGRTKNLTICQYPNTSI